MVMMLALALICLVFVTDAGTASQQVSSKETESLVRDQSDASQKPFRVGDKISVSFQIPRKELPNLKTTIKANGMLRLPLDVRVSAKGKTATQLEKEIVDLYVPEYFRRVKVAVKRVLPDEEE